MSEHQSYDTDDGAKFKRIKIGATTIVTFRYSDGATSPARQVPRRPSPPRAPKLSRGPPPPFSS